MEKTIWDFIYPFFKRREKWGNPEKMNGALLLLLYRIRTMADIGISIHCGYEDRGKNSTSQHPLGNAVDFHLVTPMALIDQINMMEGVLESLQVESHVGFGFYPNWNTPGFHLDVRGFHARWAYINGDQVNYYQAKKELII